jgi:hypothetical protein
MIDMASEFISPFLGVMPRVSPELLESGYAQTASNCNIERGILEPAKSALSLANVMQSGTKTIYWYNRTANGGNGYWFEYSSKVDILRGQIANDSSLRTYIFGSGAPKYTISSIATGGAGPYPSAVRDLGLPIPSAPTAAQAFTDPPNGEVKISTAYVITYVSDIGEESAPSVPSNIVDRWDGITVYLSSIPVASGAFNITAKRIYRAELNGVFQYVATIAAAATTFTDAILSESLGEAVPSTDWEAPSSSMAGAINLPNGIIMGWWGNTLAFCESYMPHAWPIRYRLALDYDIVGAIATSQGAIVVTTGAPYLISGSTPDGMSQFKLDAIAACIASRSVVDMGEYALYASSDGLIAIGGAQTENATAPFMTPEQWRAIATSNLIGCRYKDYYIGFYSGGSFAFKPGVGFLFFTEQAEAFFIDDKTGELYIKNGTALKKWNMGSPVSFTWKSKIFRVQNGGNPTCAKVHANAYPVTFKLYTDGSLVKTLSVTSRKTFRLPTAIRYDFYEVELSGVSPVISVQIADSMSDII